MTNTENFGIASGRLTKNPIVCDNADGSKKILLTVAATDNFRGRDGKRGSQFIPLEAFIPASKAAEGIGPYALIHEGDKVSVGYSIRNNNYQDKTTGMMVYGIVLQVDTLKLCESKSITDARQAAKTEAQAAPVADPVPVTKPADNAGKEVPVAETEPVPDGVCDTLE